jgi:Tfp pilus assembly protein PilX
MRRWLSMRFVGNERGMALIMAIGIMAVLGTAGATSMYYATAGARTSDYSNTKSGTFSLAEAGIASVMSVLNYPTTNALRRASTHRARKPRPTRTAPSPGPGCSTGRLQSGT